MCQLLVCVCLSVRWRMAMCQEYTVCLCVCLSVRWRMAMCQLLVCVCFSAVEDGNVSAPCVCMSVSAVEDGNVSAPCRVLDNTYRNAVYNWLSPEVLDGQSPTEQSDIYSYCVLIWEILHGMLTEY